LVGEDGYIRNIGKEIPLWNALDTGVFLFTYKIFEVINLIKTKYSILTLTHCVKEMIKMGFPLWACDVSGNFWMDVDTAEDVALAERVLRSA
jgi:choline kinase